MGVKELGQMEVLKERKVFKPTFETNAKYKIENLSNPPFQYSNSPKKNKKWGGVKDLGQMEVLKW